MRPRRKYLPLIIPMLVRHLSNMVSDNIMIEIVNSALLTNDNKYLISGSQDGTIRVFDFSSKRLIHHFEKIHAGNFILSDFLIYDV